MEDKLYGIEDFEIDGSQINEETFGGRAHVLWSQGSRSKRISYSTSHGETLAAINGMESSSLVALRLAELMLPDRKPTLQQLAALQERGFDELPIDHHTDCRDLFELVSGTKTLPQDKAQRVYTLALKEARLCGRIRWFVLVPTQHMTSDPLTKPMTSLPLLHLLSSGVVRFFNEGKHVILGKRLPKIDLSEDTDLEYEDSKVLQTLALVVSSMFHGLHHHRALAFALLCGCLLPGATSSPTASGFSTGCGADGGSCSAEHLSESGALYQDWSTLFLLSCILFTFISTVSIGCCLWCCCGAFERKPIQKQKVSKTLLDEPKGVMTENDDMSLMKLIKSQEREIQNLKTAVKCRDEQIDVLESCSLSVNHDVVITGQGTKWHVSSRCGHVQTSSSHKTFGPCKHCVQIKPK